MLLSLASHTHINLTVYFYTHHEEALGLEFAQVNISYYAPKPGVKGFRSPNAKGHRGPDVVLA